MNKQIFLNLPVADRAMSQIFFRGNQLSISP